MKLLIASTIVLTALLAVTKTFVADNSNFERCNGICVSENNYIKAQKTLDACKVKIRDFKARQTTDSLKILSLKTKINYDTLQLSDFRARFKKLNMMRNDSLTVFFTMDEYGQFRIQHFNVKR